MLILACENVLSEAKALGEEDASKLQRAKTSFQRHLLTFIIEKLFS